MQNFEEAFMPPEVVAPEPGKSSHVEKDNQIRAGNSHHHMALPVKRLPLDAPMPRSRGWKIGVQHSCNSY